MPEAVRTRQAISLAASKTRQSFLSFLQILEIWLWGENIINGSPAASRHDRKWLLTNKTKTFRHIRRHL